MKVDLLYTLGDGRFSETQWYKPDITDTEIEVESIYTGVCRSDVDMMLGNFGPLPLNMQGHEGLGRITRIGTAVGDCLVGDIVATRGEPAYATRYNAKRHEYVVVPEAHPRYILEPVACAVNLLLQEEQLLKQRIEWNCSARVLIIGTGFLAQVCYQLLQTLFGHSGIDIDVAGRSNADKFGVPLCSEPLGQYDVVIDLSSNDWVFTRDILKSEALVIMGTQKHTTTDFARLLWRAATVVFPSPRAKSFHAAMLFSLDLVKTGKLDLDHLWTRGYDRHTEWQLAFEHSANRPAGFNRAYLKW
jgi:D-arabinose 1-dehydrogenase-like Zn-dependent alcohol dehydrogenase